MKKLYAVASTWLSHFTTDLNQVKKNGPSNFEKHNVRGVDSNLWPKSFVIPTNPVGLGSI